jgi:aminoglycoside phosphotransferase (APT) family kinase protein
MLGAYLDDDRVWSLAVATTHNDLGPEHVLVTPTGDLAGIIDWEEVGPGDPAADFAWWLHAMPDAGQRMLPAYGGEPDRSFCDRSRIAFALMPWHDIEHGISTGDKALLASGLAAARARLP